MAETAREMSSETYFRLRLNNIDSYQGNPTSLDYPVILSKPTPPGQKILIQLPVIRVFGSTESGQKVCCHVHGAFPYLYIEYDGSLAETDVNSYIVRVHGSIDHALCKIFRRNAHDPRSVYVARITLCKGVPFFGFHVGWKYFLKIYMLNPQHMTRLADLLRSGSVMHRQFQPYEAHAQFLPQFMIDYNLYGCAFINCRKVYFRSPVPSSRNPLSDFDNSWSENNINPQNILSEMDFPRKSHCALEIDLQVHDILNRHQVQGRNLHHDFVERLHPIPLDQKLLPSMEELWRDEERRRGLRGMSSKSFGVSFSAEPRKTRLGWIHENEYLAKVDEIIQMEKEAGDGEEVKWNTFVQNDPESDSIKSSWETVEDFYPANQEAEEQSRWVRSFADGDTEVDVDEDRFELEGDAIPAVVGENGIGKKNKKEEQERSPEESSTSEESESESDTATEEDPSIAVLRTEDELSAYGILPDIAPLSAFSIHDFYLPQSLFGKSCPPEKRRDDRMTLDGPSRPVKLRKIDAGPGRPDDYAVESIFAPKTPRKSMETQTPSGSFSKTTPRNSFVAKTPSKSSFNIKIPNSARRSVTFKDDLKEPASPSERKQSNESLLSVETSKAPNTPKTPSPPTPTSGANGSQKSLKSFNFPVVKDTGTETILRLSQESSSQKSSSQKTIQNEPETPSKDGFLFNATEMSAGSSIPTLTFDSQASRAHYITQLGESILADFDISNQFLVLSSFAPDIGELDLTWDEYGLPKMIYQEAYYSKEKDVPERPREYAGREFRLESKTLPFLPVFSADGRIGERIRTKGKKTEVFRAQVNKEFEYGIPPPSREEIEEWLELEAAKETAPACSSQYDVNPDQLSQIEAPTQKNRHGFKFSQKNKSANVMHIAQHMSIMSLEVHTNSREDLLPDPAVDEVSCIFYCFQSTDQEQESQGLRSAYHTGVIINSENSDDEERLRKLSDLDVDWESSELDMFTRLISIVHRLDPDIITGYEVHNSSWGYLIERARKKYEYNLCDELSRMKSQSFGRFGKDMDKWGFNHTSSIRITGRHLINIWRAMRGELNLLQYSLENVAFHLLHERVPHYSHRTLTSWFSNRKPRQFTRLVKHFLRKVKLNLNILEAQELVSRTSEQARVLGIDFLSVFNRGSQFKVESLMLRIAKPESLLLISPSRKEVGSQNALECIPLVMEPQSDFYTSPLLVLDFQSLYPSVMIAYNYCYSTCLGRVLSWMGKNKIGFIDYQRQTRLLELLDGQYNVAPNGLIYVKPEIRRSLLAKMLTEILETRVMVKSGMKADKDDKTLQQLLNNRQLALKLIANVTYGYTSASFSGRMPCAEIADSIVQSGRETLEKAISIIHSEPKWGAEVVYGDTDSVFVYLPGKTKDEAFDIGEEIAKQVTDANPRPIKLKFEKVYHPCVLLAKKRYVGFKYESRDQVEPEFDAKGIETVRRDGTPAEQKIEEMALKLLFRTADLSQVKEYFQRQCSKIMNEKVSIQDFCFAKEVRLGTYSDKGMGGPPGALVATKKMMADHRAEPQYGERVPYVVITGAPGARLADRCVAPEELLENIQNRLDAEYYISKNLIPPLERIFNLVGANIRSWYDEMPRVQKLRRVEGISNKELQSKGKTIEAFMKASSCIVCRSRDTEHGICDQCKKKPAHSVYKLQNVLSKAEKRVASLNSICRSCSDTPFGESIDCISKDCPVFYSRERAVTLMRADKALIEPFIDILNAESLKQLDW